MMKNKKNLLQVYIDPRFIGFLLLLLGCAYFFIDRPLADFFYQHGMREKLAFLNPVILLGKWQVIMLILLLVGIYGFLLNKGAGYMKKLGFVLVAVCLCNFVCLFFKISFGRARPDLFFEDHLYGFYFFKLSRNYWSFPSGHTANTIAFMLSLSFIFRSYWRLFMGFGFFIALTRILMFHHYLSDVLAGIYLSLLLVTLVYERFFQRYLTE